MKDQARGRVKEEHSTQGFSFQLSASAPPAEVVHHDPLPGALDPLEPGWFGPTTSLDPLDPLDPDIPTRTPAPVHALATETFTVPDEHTAPQPSSAPPSADHELRPPAPAIKRISFPKAGTTVFSDSVSQVPRVRLESTDDDPLDDILDAPPEDLPLRAAKAPSLPRATAGALADSMWRNARRWALEGGRLTARAARSGGGRAAAATRAAARRAAEAWAHRRSTASSSTRTPPESQDPRAPEPSLSGEDVSPIIESTPRPPSVIVERVRPVLPAVAALAAAGACYMVVAGLVSPPEGAADASSASEGERSAAAATPTTTETAGKTAVPEATEDPTASVPAAAKAAGSTPRRPGTEEPAHTEQLALPDGLSWPGKGLIEVVTAGRELIYVDGVFTGRGPLRRIPVAPGKHEVLLRTESSELMHAVDVAVDRRTRLLVGDGPAAGDEPEPDPKP